MAWASVVWLLCVLGGVLVSLSQHTLASPAPLRVRSEGEALVKKLYDKTSSTQTLHEIPYRELRQWHQAQGVYQSEVKLNFHGGPAFAEFRRLFQVFDNNMFATAWVTSNLLEAYKFGAAPRPTDNQINLALQAIERHVDKNVAYNTSTMVFWPEVYNKTTDYWTTTPDNLLYLFDTTDRFPVGFLETILKAMGLGELAKDIQGLLDSKALFKRAFRVPPDFDDTFVNLGLGAMLYDLRGDLKSSWQAWHQNNRNISSALDALKAYAYRPFSKDRDVNTIDPRTYYYLRGFLDKASAAGEDIALATTWAENLNQTRKLFAGGNRMPFNINNVDATVAADVVFGITSGILSGLLSPDVLDDPDIAQIYLNTSALLAYEVSNNLTSRPDLALTYYPSVIEYYWFVAKTVNVMETALKKGALPSRVMDQVFLLLKPVCVGAMTTDILARAISEEKEKYYFDDFLGNGDKTIFGRPSRSHEDRMFTTAMAANALLYTWTIFDDATGKCQYRHETPEKVESLISGIINWLSEYTLSGKYKPWNAFFSGSMKGPTCVPFWYPGNRFEYLNGTVIKDYSKVPRGPFIYGVEGHIPQEKYEAMIREKHFHKDTPTEFPGYNAAGGFFPFWSSDSYTYSCALLAVARYENIVG